MPRLPLSPIRPSPRMKYLTLIRHAKSDWNSTTLSDHERPLNERGLRNAPAVARFLAKTYFGANGGTALIPKPDRLVTSTATRAQRTAWIMQNEIGVSKEHVILDPRAYLALPETLLQIVHEFDDSWNHVMMFAHNPGISDFANRLFRLNHIDEMSTCAVALLELPWDLWSAAAWSEARLIGYVTPKLIEKRFADELVTESR